MPLFTTLNREDFPTHCWLPPCFIGRWLKDRVRYFMTLIFEEQHLELCTGYTRDQISDCFGWFEDEFQPLLLDDPNENHGLWSEAADDDDIVQKINPLDMNYVVRIVMSY
jgi:hypothetical protein